jgi:hypothetical protein
MFREKKNLKQKSKIDLSGQSLKKKNIFSGMSLNEIIFFVSLLLCIHLNK